MKIIKKSITIEFDQPVQMVLSEYSPPLDFIGVEIREDLRENGTKYYMVQFTFSMPGGSCELKSLRCRGDVLIVNEEPQ